MPKGNSTIARHLSFCLALVAALASCGEGILSTRPTSVPLGFLRGELDGARADAPAYAFFSGLGPDDTQHLLIHAAFPSGGSTELRLWIQIPFTGLGTYALDSTQVGGVELVGGDVHVGDCAGSRPTPGELVVTAYDSATRTIRGTVRFSLARWSAATGWQPWAEFADGEFEVPIVVPKD